MLKHLRYFLSPFIIFVGILTVLKGNYYPIIFIFAFDIFIELGDTFLKEDDKPFENPIPFILNSALYINLPLLFVFLSLVLFVLVDTSPEWYMSLWNYLGVDLLDVRANITFADKCALLVYFTPLFIATMGTNVGHELTHRKRNKFDMFIGNWSLALSWDCTFAIEHVYGHHKNIGLKDDPATAKREESVYLFILRGTIKAHKDAWKIEINRLKRASKFPFTLNNKMIQGYLRTSILYVISFYIGGLTGLGVFLLWSILAKSLLETINFVEHYGLVRVEGQPVLPKHSWNSNHVISSSLLYNLNRHSAHHEKANLRYWELKAYPNAPKLPYGYLRCLYIAYFMPILFKRIMRSRLKAWDAIYASAEERELVKKYN